MKCSRCGTTIDGSLRARGFVWCQHCSAKIATESAYDAPDRSALRAPDAARCLVWRATREGQRYMSLVDADFAKTLKLEKVKL